MLPLRYDSFDNDYICGKGDSKYNHYRTNHTEEV